MPYDVTKRRTHVDNFSKMYTIAGHAIRLAFIGVSFKKETPNRQTLESTSFVRGEGKETCHGESTSNLRAVNPARYCTARPLSLEEKSTGARGSRNLAYHSAACLDSCEWSVVRGHRRALAPRPQLEPHPAPFPIIPAVPRGALTRPRRRRHRRHCALAGGGKFTPFRPNASRRLFHATPHQ